VPPVRTPGGVLASVRSRSMTFRKGAKVTKD
jgi:hypothetical protein